MKQTPRKTTTLKNLGETAAFALSFVKNIKSSRNEATVFGLSGNLGSGKTTFTKEVAHVLGIKKEEVTSPTFVIMKIYKLQTTTKNNKSKATSLNNSELSIVNCWSHLIHIDAYRLEKADELLHLGWKEIISDPKNLILIEWPERVAEILPKSTRMVYFTFIDETTRRIQMTNDES